MSFIGIIANKKQFKNIKKNVNKNISENIIDINEENIENIKNVVFETIIINKKLKWKKEKYEYLEKIYGKVKFLVINSDESVILKNQQSHKSNIITFGMNDKATATISSVTEDRILISLQRNIINVEGKTVEVEERVVENNKNNIYEILIEYILNIIYQK